MVKIEENIFKRASCLVKVFFILSIFCKIPSTTLLAEDGGKSPNKIGKWSEVFDWPLIALHATLLWDGRVLTYGTNGDGQQTGYFIYDVWNPEWGFSKAAHTTLPNTTKTDLFCSASIVIPSGDSNNILITGGDNWVNQSTNNEGNDNSNIFNSEDNSLTRGKNMAFPRWYGSLTTLPNGEAYVQGGYITGPGDKAIYPEIRSINGDFRLLTGASTETISYNYPRNFVAPDGRIFGFVWGGKMYYVDTVGIGSIKFVGSFPIKRVPMAATVMYRPGQVIQLDPDSTQTILIDFRNSPPTWTKAKNISRPRIWANGAILPSGEVLFTGGSSRFDDEGQEQVKYAVNYVEIWNPDTGEWTVGASGAKPRLYHSTSLLLKDGSVLIAGGGSPGPVSNTNAEIYYPPYLFDSDGEFAERPLIASSTQLVKYGEDILVQLKEDSDLEKVVLIKTGAVTHSNNMEQRYIEPVFKGTGKDYVIKAPDDKNLATPGNYHLFVLNTLGVPSISKIVKLGE